MSGLEKLNERMHVGGGGVVEDWSKWRVTSQVQIQAHSYLENKNRMDEIKLVLLSGRILVVGPLT